jgi:hypothetical protein
MLRAKAEGERRFDTVPRGLLALFVAALLMHAVLRHVEPRPSAVAAALPALPTHSAMLVASLGERQALAQGLMLYLQAFDNQPGVSVPFAALDYARVMAWLAAALRLDDHTQYPLMMASQLYGQVNDADRQRAMCEFVHRVFIEQPDQRWRWLAHCAIMARHRLKDMPLALRYAEDITQRAGQASSWARQMRIFLLADMGEVERAKVLLGGLLAGNEVRDAKEQHFLTEQLLRLQRLEGAGEHR